MCLYVSLRTTQQELKNKEDRIFYKVFLKRVDYIETPYQKHIIRSPGVITVPEPLKRIDVERMVMISGGVFHAKIKPEASKQDVFYAKFFKLGETVRIPIHVKYEDILVYGLLYSVAILAYEIKEEIWNGIFT